MRCKRCLGTGVEFVFHESPNGIYIATHYASMCSQCRGSGKVSFKYFWNVYIRAPLLRRYWEYRNKNFICKAGYGCEWVYPYGFVPEADCPIHDR